MSLPHRVFQRIAVVEVEDQVVVDHMPAERNMHCVQRATSTESYEHWRSSNKANGTHNSDQTCTNDGQRGQDTRTYAHIPST